MVDWNGLLNPLFPGVEGSADTTLSDMCKSRCSSSTFPFRSCQSYSAPFDKQDHEWVASFDVKRYYGCNDAMDSVLVINFQLVPRDHLYLDKTTTFICDVTSFDKAVVEGQGQGVSSNLWIDEAIEGVFTITSDPEICPPGISTRYAWRYGSIAAGAPLPPHRYIVIVCPELLTQTEGKPKIFPTMDGQELDKYKAE